MDLRNQINDVKTRIADAASRSNRKPEEISLLAVTKTLTVETLREAFEAGLREFGENRIQEALKKMDALPPDIRWHLIGRIQRNKVNKITGRFVLIHSIDSLEIAGEIEKRLNGASQEILLEVNTSGESTKAGVEVSRVLETVNRLSEWAPLKLRGLMTIGPLTSDPHQQRDAFKRLKEIFEQAKGLPSVNGSFDILSMGMSSDYEAAIEEGSTLVRIGTAIFGSRPA